MTYTPTTNDKILRLCNKAWQILLRHKYSGLTTTSLKAWMRNEGESIGYEFSLTMEKNGYLLWIDGNRLKPFRHPSGAFVEYDEMVLFDADKFGMAVKNG